MTGKTQKISEKSWATTDDEISLVDFKRAIQKAESGTFHSIEESKEILNEWRERRKEK